MERSFAAKNVYPSEIGLHIEHYTEEEARASYEACKNKGVNVRLDGLILTWQFHNPRSPHLVGDATKQGRKTLKINRDRSRQPQRHSLRGVSLSRKLYRARKAARPPHVET